MKIGHKIAMLQICSIVVFAFFVTLLGNYFERAAVDTWEREEVQDNLLRVDFAWKEQLSMLSSLVGDWAPWDELYEFTLQPGQSSFVANNLTDQAMANLRISGVIIANDRGREVFSKQIDPTEKTAQAMDDGLQRELLRLVMVKGQALSGEQNAAGFIMHGDSPVLYSLQPILTSGKEGPSTGYLLFFRQVDAQLLAELGEHTRVMVRGSSEVLPEQMELQGMSLHHRTADTSIESQLRLQDAYGQRGYSLLVTTPRGMKQYAQEKLYHFLLLTALFVCGLAIVMLPVLNRLLHRKISQIDGFMRNITDTQDYSGRLQVTGKDELAHMAAALNQMLDKIEAGQKEIKRLYRLGQQELRERKTMEERLLRQGTHDSLTALHNRFFFDAAIAELEGRHVSLGILCCDVDGLKFINDTLGHERGDLMLQRVAKILTSVLPAEAIICRIGGDEFAVLMPETSEEQIKDLVQNIRSAAETMEGGLAELGVVESVSIGWAYQDSGPLQVEEMRQTLKQADDNMYRQKLHSQSSNRHALIQGMMEMLKVRDFITEGHSQRLQERVVAVGQALHLEEDKLSNLVLLAQFHDIGKVGVPDAILFKTGSLNDHERREMQRHAEVGYRIAQSIRELYPISDLILKHHEWWNGQGYPLGLAGEEIPIEDRILAVTDAYDAMTNNRPYRKAMTSEEAVAELRRQAGKQFDPDVVEEFIAVVEAESGVEQAAAVQLPVQARKEEDMTPPALAFDC